MFVRTAGERDLAGIKALLAETWHATYDALYGAEEVEKITAAWHSPDALKRQLTAPNSEFLVADDGSAICGVAYGVVDGDIVTLRQLYVKPALQGRGIGGMLLDEIESAFPEGRRLRLEVDEANDKAIAFYLAQGFAKVGTTQNCGQAQSGIPAAIYERAIRWA
ncbi:MAG: GNAT family N-acetyltransferase [Rhizobiaceae bacterium]|nr:GNAT family N-acetyltransferase [Rhizobiaceae bacterium]